MFATKKSEGVVPEVNLRNQLHANLPLKERADVTRKSRTEIFMAPKKQPMFFKNKSVTLSGRASDLQSQDCFFFSNHFSLFLLNYSSKYNIFIAGFINGKCSTVFSVQKYNFILPGGRGGLHPRGFVFRRLCIWRLDKPP